MGHILCKGAGVATVNKNPEMLPFLHKAYSLVGEASQPNKLNDKCLKDLKEGPRERLKGELFQSGQKWPP